MNILSKVDNMSTTSLAPKLTPHQRRILNLLEAVDREMSAKDLYIQLRETYKTLGLATVYRGLEILRLQGAIQSRTSIEGEFLYSLIQKHHHHLTCLRCNKSVEIDNCSVCQIENELAKKQTFKVFYHTLEFFGLCTFCQAADD